MNTQLPRSRKDGLTVQHVENDVLVYDSVNVKAHSLNRTAALVWKYADGKCSLNEIANLVGKELGAPVSVETVEYALAQLTKSGLLETSETSPVWSNLTRREFIKAASTAALLVPVVKTIRIPEPAQRGSCLENGSTCEPTTGPNGCCSRICCEGPGFQGFQCVGSTTQCFG